MPTKFCKCMQVLACSGCIICLCCLFEGPICKVVEKKCCCCVHSSLSGSSRVVKPRYVNMQFPMPWAAIRVAPQTDEIARNCIDINSVVEDNTGNI